MTRHEKAMARQAAIADIKSELKRTGRAFIAFATVLNPVMNAIVEQYAQQQDSLTL